MRTANYGLCPSCKSRNLFKPGAKYRCGSCDNRFYTPLNEAAEARRQKSGSGVVAGLTYRAQLAREALARGVQVCVIAANFNPKHSINGRAKQGAKQGKLR